MSKVAAAVVVIILFTVMIGRAIDHEQAVQQRVLTTRHGVMLDCRIDHYEDGSAYLNDCNRVTP